MSVSETEAASGDFVCLSFRANPSVLGHYNQIRFDSVVRRAMAMAVNRTQVIQLMYAGLASEGSTVISPVLQQWHLEPSGSDRIEYDIDLANQLLEDSGYIDIDSDGIRKATPQSTAVVNGWVSEGENLTFLLVLPRKPDYIRGKSYPEVGSSLASDFARIGVELQYRGEDVPIPLDSPYGHIPWPYDVSLTPWWAFPPDPHFMLFCGSTKAIRSWSDSCYSNSTYDEAFDAAVSALDRDERRSWVFECQKQFYIDCPYIVLAYPHACYVWSQENFLGWGDWTAHPGRQICSPWLSASPLLYDLEPTSNTAPCALLSSILGMGTVFVAACSAAVAGIATGVYAYLTRRRAAS